MNLLHNTIYLCVILVCIEYSLGSLDNALHYYETLHHTDIQHRISKRSITGTKHITFSALGRDFKLFLQNSKGLLSSEFRAVSVDKQGNEHPYAVEGTAFYTGYDEDESHSIVKAYWEGDSLSATIRTPKDVYIVEPSWRHLPESNNYSMIAYKGSDVKTKFDKDHPNHEGPSFCGSVRETGTSNDPRMSDDEKLSAYEDKTERENRVKRAAFDPNKKSCPLLVVGDYRFFSNMGQSNLASATNYLIGLIDRVDAIYRGTEFEPGLKGFGFEIKEIKVHTDWSDIPQGDFDHYNMESVGWKTKDLLEAFSRTPYYRTFCLAHLFTHWSFSGGVLGLAYIASSLRNTVGGICTTAYYQNGQPMYLNTGWSSSLNRAGRRILTSEADLVTTHEFGHNWGSEHDPDTPECSPSSYDGGKHIMYTYSVSGYEVNNKVFSNCSRRSINQVLKAKSADCFKEVSLTKGFCGNNRVEEGEDCDGGLEGQEDKDSCCTPQCKFKPTAKCSDSNDKCCENCDYAPITVTCYKSAETDLACNDDANCDGTSAKCPDPPPKPDFTKCFENGTCRNGVCLAFCESNGKESCICDSVEQSCLYCCRDAAQSHCIPYPSQNPNQPYFFLPDGKPCAHGFCNNTGVCEKQVVDLVQRFWNVIRDISFSDVVAFMRANIVGTIIIFSLLIWIPASCVISYVDRKKQREERENLEWLKPDNASLHRMENTRVSHSENTRRRPVVDLHRSAMTGTAV